MSPVVTVDIAYHELTTERCRTMKFLVDIHNSTLFTVILYVYFVTEFPAGCRYHRGPHSLECLGAIWYDAHCVVEGNLFPELDFFDHTAVNSNISWVLFDCYLHQPLTSVVKRFAFNAEGLGFDSWTGQIGHSVANGSPPLSTVRHRCNASPDLCNPGTKSRRWSCHSVHTSA